MLFDKDPARLWQASELPRLSQANFASEKKILWGNNEEGKLSTHLRVASWYHIFIYLYYFVSLSVKTITLLLNVPIECVTVSILYIPSFTLRNTA